MKIPQLTLEALVRYVEQGIPTGSFTTAVLTNDLFMAVGAADENNILALREIVQWLYWVPPGGCKGSPEKVQAWLDLDPEERTSVLARCPSWQEFKQEETAPSDQTGDGSSDEKTHTAKVGG